MTLNNFRTGSTSGIVISVYREWTSLQFYIRKGGTSWNQSEYRWDTKTRARAGDRCLRDRDNCAHLGVVNRVHNKCVWVRGRAAWHTRCGARRVSRRTTEYECAHLRGRRPAEWRGSGALPDPGCAPTAAGPQTNRTQSDIGLSCHLPKMT